MSPTGSETRETSASIPGGPSAQGEGAPAREASDSREKAARSSASPRTASGPWRPHRAWAWEDLTRDLLWPLVLRAPALALRPERLAVAFFALVVLALLAKVPELWLAAGDPLPGLPGRMAGAFSAAIAELAGGNLHAAGHGFANALWFLPKEAVFASPISAAVLYVPSIAVWIFAGLALCRMMACDAAQGTIERTPSAVAFAVRNFTSAACAVLAPAVVTTVAIAGLAVAGWFFFELMPGLPLGGMVRGIGAMLYVGAVLVSFVIVVGAAVLVVGQPLVLPSVACDKSDAIDALQRAAAYTINRPLRLLSYLALAGLQLVVTVTIAFALASAVVWVARETTQAFLSEDARAALGLGTADSEAAASGFASWFVGFWSALPALIAGAYAFSCLKASCTLVYLCVRQINDGQDVAEIWMPTMIPGTLAQLRARGVDDEE